MSNFQDIKRAVKAIEEEGNKKINILHCVSDYPTQIQDSNLNIIDTFTSHIWYPQIVP